MYELVKRENMLQVISLSGPCPLPCYNITKNHSYQVKMVSRAWIPECPLKDNVLCALLGSHMRF